MTDAPVARRSSLSLERLAAVDPRNGRRRHALLTGLLAAVALVALLVSCSTAGTTTVSLRALVKDPASFDGHIVRTAGNVHRFRDNPTAAPYFVLEDDQNDRVLLSPAGPLGSLVNQHVEVEGCFSYDLQHGQRLAVRRVLRPRPGTSSPVSQGVPCRSSRSSA